MKNLFTLLFIFAATFLVAQELPQPSPAATVEQTIGLTEFEVVYSRPGAKDRDVFGNLVPFDALWRTGANKATAISFNNDITFGGKQVKAGTYSLFTIPGKNEWTLILNTETELWGTGGYKKENDVARVKVETQKAKDFEETFTIGFSNIDDESANLYLKWEKTMVAVAIGVKTADAAWANIEAEIQSLEGSWRVYTRAADYAASTGKNLDEAIEWTNKSLEMNESWWTLWVQAKVYAAKGDYAMAQSSLKKSIDLGNQTEGWGYGDRLNKLMEEYKKKG
ncbi:MAG: DUF2911 domain-containing protein [Bacteroidia bacterium]